MLWQAKKLLYSRLNGEDGGFGGGGHNKVFETDVNGLDGCVGVDVVRGEMWDGASGGRCCVCWKRAMRGPFKGGSGESDVGEGS